MAAIRTFNKMITKRLLGEDTSSDDSDRFRMIKFEADVTEESGPVTVAPADDEGGFTLMGFSSYFILYMLSCNRLKFL